MSILVVDDEQSMIDMMSAVLQRSGFHQVHFARSGVEALKMLGIAHPQHRGRYEDVQPRHIDLAIVDIMLPDIMGFEICLAIKNQVSPHLPVILMTGYPIEAHHARFVESGADDFLSKPFHPPELVARLGLHLRRKLKQEEENRRQVTTQPHFKPIAGLAHLTALVDTAIAEYRVTEAMTWSGASMILKAVRQADGLPCVIKMLTRHALEYHDVLQRFTLETRIMRELEHPNVVRVLGAGHHEGCPYYVMEYLDGQNLEAIVGERDQVDDALLRRVAVALARALDYIHQQHVVHRDVKPKNVFLLQDGTVKLGDFGIAIVLGDLRVTREGYSIGTPIYMAPEQFDGGRVGVATDIYSYGATLYHLLTGQPPFSATSAMEMLRKHLTVTPAPLEELRPGLAPGWNDLVVRRCLAKRPEDRPASMADVLAALAALGAE
jgi:serine/threonine protein kinase